MNPCAECKKQYGEFLCNMLGLNCVFEDALDKKGELPVPEHIDTITQKVLLV